MSTISTFLSVSADGFFAGPNGEIDWFHSVEQTKDYYEFTHSQASSHNTLFLGRTTYEMMKSYWPTPDAIKADPQMADAVNNSRKVVFSKTLRSLEEGPNWKHLELRHDIDRDEILALKRQNDVTILGSGSIVQQLTNLGLMDSYMLAIVPVVLGNGKPLFKDVQKTKLKLEDSKSFDNGVVVNTYSPYR